MTFLDRGLARSTFSAPLAHLSLLLTAMIWGAAFVAVKYVVERTGPEGVLLMRSWLASVCFILLLGLTWRSVPRMPSAVWKRLALIAFCGSVVNNVAIAVGQSYLAAALASLIVTSNPIFTTIFSRLLLGEPLTRRKLSGIAIAFTGFLIVLLCGRQQRQLLGRQRDRHPDPDLLAARRGDLHRPLKAAAGRL